MPAPRPNLTHAVWRKSSHSNPSGGDCLEVAVNIPGHLPVRDSKRPDIPALVFPRTTWTSFIDSVKRAGLDS